MKRRKATVLKHKMIREVLILTCERKNDIVGELWGKGEQLIKDKENSNKTNLLIFTMTELPELLQLIFAASGDWHSLRLVCRSWNANCDQVPHSLSLVTDTPVAVAKLWIHRLCLNKALNRLSMVGCLCVDECFIGWFNETIVAAQGYPDNIALVDWSFCNALAESDLALVCQMNKAMMHHCNAKNDSLAMTDSRLVRLMAFDDCALLLLADACVIRVAGCFAMLKPHPCIAPKDVVLLQLEALRCNQLQHCYKFASMANRSVTGPLSRFASMIRRYYSCLIGFHKVTVVQVTPSDESLFKVTVFNSSSAALSNVFLWQLSKASRDATYPELDNCWMTDGVSFVEDH